MESINVVTSVLVALGVPAIMLAIVNFFLKRIEDNKKQTMEETKALKLGMQALLRHELYNMYDKACKTGSKSVDELEDFENMYGIYHNLGANGVMDTIANEYKNKIPLT